MIDKKREGGFGLVEVLVVMVIIGIIFPVLHRIFMIPFITQAKAINFQKAELKATTYSLISSNKGELIDPVPDGCTVKSEDEQLKIYSIECIEGNISQVKARAKSNIYLQKISLFAGDFVDSNMDGYEDTTGLPTHYDECYSGFKGNAGSSFKDASCELGGDYLIPMYGSLYNESSSN